MNWISLQDINFKLFEFYKIRNKGFSSLELKHMVYAHAKFGGPIAITSDPDAFIMGNDANNDAIKNICIFRNDGNLLRRISKEGMPKIVGMDFLDEEYLFVITQEGSYILVDPHKGTKRSYRLDSRFMAEPIIEAKVIGNSVIFYTGLQGSFKFYFVRNIFTPNCEPFSHGEIKTKPAFFLPVSPKCSLSERLECLVTHSSAGIHRLVEDQDEMILFNPANASSAFLAQLPTIKEIKLIAMSPSNDIEKQMIAFLTKDNNLFVVSSDFTKILMTKDEVSKDLKDSKGWKKAVKLMWCGEDAVVLFVGRTIHLITEHNIVEKEIKNTKALLPMQEVDGIKITSSNKCEILRALPPYYVNIFKINSSAKAKDLYEAYEDYEQRQASYENNILTEKKGLQEAVEECVEAACFELNITEQLKLLRAAHFGKTFLNPNNSTFDHNKFSHACKILRVISAFRSDGFDCLARSLTFAQFQGLSELQVTRILVRYQLYYVADEICKFLGYSPKLISQVCVNWACAKIESTHEAGESSEQQQENLANIIYEKLKNESTISFAEIARKAVEIGKDHLARKLLDKEKSFSKKLQVLLEMKDYLSSLREAIYSRDPNLIEMVIFKMQRDNLPEQSVWTLLSKTPLSKKLLLEYLKNFKPESLNVYMMDHSTGDERAFYAIKNGYNIKDLPQRMAVIQDFALKFFEDKFAKDMTKEHYQYLSHLIKENGIKSDEVPINTHLETLFREGKFEKAEKVRKEFKISDRNFYTVKAKCFINEKKWEELDALLNDKNKKSQTIPWFVVVDLLSEKSEYDLVEKYVVKLPDVDEQITILKMINRFAAAVDVAYKNKRGEALEEMENHPAIDKKTRDTIDSMLISLRRR